MCNYKLNGDAITNSTQYNLVYINHMFLSSANVSKSYKSNIVAISNLVHHTRSFCMNILLHEKSMEF